MKEAQFKADLVELARALITTIADDDRCSDDPDDENPGILVTVGADANGWGYQTGGNSYSGGAYGFATWGLGYLYRDTDPEEFASAILSDLADGAPDDEYICEEWAPWRVSVWEERDRLHIHLFAGDESRTIADWWDDDARQMFEDGFFDRRRLEASVIEYARSVNLHA